MSVTDDVNPELEEEKLDVVSVSVGVALVIVGAELLDKVLVPAVRLDASYVKLYPPTL